MWGMCAIWWPLVRLWERGSLTRARGCVEADMQRVNVYASAAHFVANNPYVNKASCRSDFHRIRDALRRRGADYHNDKNYSSTIYAD